MNTWAFTIQARGFLYFFRPTASFLLAQMVKNLPAIMET